MSLHTSQHGHLKNSTTINAGGGVERRELSYPRWECKSVHPLWRTARRGFQTLSNKVPCDPAIPCLGMDPGKTKISRYCTPTIMASLDTLAKVQKKPECRRTGEWLKKPGSVQFSSVAQSCPTLCDPMNRSIPGLPVHHQLPEFTQTHVHQVSDAIQPSHPLSSPFQ